MASWDLFTIKPFDTQLLMTLCLKTSVATLRSGVAESTGTPWRLGPERGGDFLRNQVAKSPEYAPTDLSCQLPLQMGAKEMYIFGIYSLYESHKKEN